MAKRELAKELDDLKNFTLAALGAQVTIHRQLIDLMQSIESSLVLIAGRDSTIPMNKKREGFPQSRAAPEDDFTPVSDFTF